MPHRIPGRLIALLLTLMCSLGAVSVVGEPVAAAGTSASASADDDFAPMRPGDTGWRVRVLQSRLHQLGLHSEVVTNRFDAETRAGVATFQRRRGWTADG